MKRIVASFSIVDYVLFAVMLAISSAIGIYFSCVGGRQKSTTEFLMAGRNMGCTTVALSLLASFMSAITLLGTPAEIYTYGTQYVVLALSYCLVIPASAHVFFPFFFKLKITSTYEYLEMRFHKCVRVIGAMIFILQMTIYLALVLYAPSLALNAVTGLNVWLSVFSCGIVCTFYTTLGGMKAVMWTDTFQICMMYAGLLAILIQGSIIHGGFDNIWEISKQGKRIEFDNFDPDPTARHTWFSLVIGGFFTWAAIYCVNQAQVQRVFTVKKLRTAQIALWVNLPGLVSLLILCSLIGLVCYATYEDCDPLTNGDIFANDQILPLFVMDKLSHITGLPGLFTACIFSGALSTMSSGLNSLATVCQRDIICLLFFKNLSDARQTYVAKGLALGFGLVMMALTFVAAQLGGVLQAALGIFGMIGGPLLGLFMLGMFFPWANWKGAVVGVLSGLIITLWIGVGAQIHKPHYPKAPISTAMCPMYNITDLTENSTSIFAISILPQLHNDTTTTMAMFTNATVHQERSRDVYSLSYMWYGTVAVVSTCTIGMIVSGFTGFTNPQDLDPLMISPLFDGCCCYLPASWRKKLHCGVRHGLEVEDDEKKDGIQDKQDTENGTTNPAFTNVQSVL